MATAGTYTLVIRAVDATTSVVAKINKSFVQQNKLFDQLNKSTRTLGNELKRTANITGITSITRSVKAFGQQIGEAAKTTTKLLGGMGILTGAASAAGIAALVSKFSTFNFNLTNNARAIGVSAAALERFQNIASLAGIDTVGATTALAGLGMVMEDAINGRAPEALSLFQQLGINIRGIGAYAKDPIAILPELADKFAAMGDSAGAAAVKMQIAGKLGIADLLPLLNLGRTQMEKYLKVVDYYSTRNAAGAKAAERLRYQQALLELSIRSMGYALAEALEPALTALNEAIIPVINRMRDWLVVNKGWINLKIHESIELIGKVINRVWAPLNQFVTRFIGWKNVLIGIGAILAVAFAIPVIRFLISPLIIASKLIWLLSRFGLPLLIRGIALLSRALVAMAFANPVLTLIALAILAIGVAAYEIYQHWDVVGPWLKKQWEWLRDTTIDIGNAISKAWNNTWISVRDRFWSIWTPLIDKFKGAWSSVGTFFDDLWNQVVEKFQSGYDKIGKVVNKLVSAGLLPKSSRVGLYHEDVPIAAGTEELIAREEGFQSKAYWDKNAWRVGFGSDTTTDPKTGVVTPVTASTTTTKEEAQVDLHRRVGEFGSRAAGQIGLDVWNRLTSHQQGAITSVAYNYGHVPESLITAARTGNPQAISEAIASLSANPQRRQREAQHSLVTSAADTPPIAPKQPNGQIHVKVDFGNAPPGMKVSTSATGTGLRVSHSRTAGSLLA